MLENIDKALSIFLSPLISQYRLSVALIFIGAIVIGFSGQFLIAKIINRYLTYVSAKTETSLDDNILKLNVFNRLARIFPALLFYLVTPLILSNFPYLIDLIRKLIVIYLIMLGANCISLFLTALERTYEAFPSARNRPIKSYIQMAKILLFLAALIVVISLIINRSPVVLLSGLGALTAVLLLVFKDAILGLVASIQLAANDMVRIGDWIEMPKHNADGDVIDINLTTIKVRNWDKTISMLPSHVFLTDSFKNWRGMSEFGGRRIKRSIPIDMTSVRFCTQEMLERFKKMTILIPYLEQKISEIETYNESNQIDLDEVVNGRRLTNLGTFRAYALAYLKNHPQVHSDMTLIVRHLQPGPDGALLEIYVFCSDIRWAYYEGIQADIFDHLFAVAPEFGLRLAQRPIGGDLRALAPN